MNGKQIEKKPLATMSRPEGADNGASRSSLAGGSSSGCRGNCQQVAV